MDPTICRMCGQPRLALPEQQAYGVCAECFRLPGFFPLPPLNRPLKPCRACGSRELVRAIAFERAAFGNDYVTAYAMPLSVAFRKSVRPASPWREEAVHVTEDDVAWQIGLLELLICRGCGLVSWHALDPQRIPIGPEYGTELVRVEDEGGPYR